MPFDPVITAAGLLVGLLVGLTGIGGGALATPILILLFKVPPLAAVGSDLLASVATKLIGGLVHLRRGTVRTNVVKWLAVGSIPGAFSSVLILHAAGTDAGSLLISHALGFVLIVSSVLVLLRGQISHWLARRDAAHSDSVTPVRRWLTIALGAVGGVVVGMTSVGSGSVMIVLLVLLYPGLGSAELVGTDLVQAFLLVAAGALAHMLLGEARFDVVGSLLVGELPGVYIGARLSARASDRALLPVLACMLALTGARLV